EAAHGWYGNGVRIGCWEDFVLSEGTATYLAARALGEFDVDLWGGYECALKSYCTSPEMNTVALPATCGAIDILTHPLWSGVPYMKGAFFFKSVADVIGVEELDAVLASFYQVRVGTPARMDALIAALAAAHPAQGEEINGLADSWPPQAECTIDPATLRNSAASPGADRARAPRSPPSARVGEPRRARAIRQGRARRPDNRPTLAAAAARRRARRAPAARARPARTHRPRRRSRRSSSRPPGRAPRRCRRRRRRRHRRRRRRRRRRGG